MNSSSIANADLARVNNQLTAMMNTLGGIELPSSTVRRFAGSSSNRLSHSGRLIRARLSNLTVSHVISESDNENDNETESVGTSLQVHVSESESVERANTPHETATARNQDAKDAIISDKTTLRQQKRKREKDKYDDNDNENSSDDDENEMEDDEDDNDEEKVGNEVMEADTNPNDKDYFMDSKGQQEALDRADSNGYNNTHDNNQTSHIKHDPLYFLRQRRMCESSNCSQADSPNGSKTEKLQYTRPLIELDELVYENGDLYHSVYMDPVLMDQASDPHVLLKCGHVCAVKAWDDILETKRRQRDTLRA
ncbi:hypothetical protein RFI_03907 [Reticulomyxa filosa]|uniref:Uncharacterized protein n=1 Tax=Reticulomyxa filosa TaxID=46433 RepID=X6P4S0_RETFI|nr:hypothetical protein RFI_03907 [Reticulomyxa filosa]|eukprot:ETO33201.1 hypothetical protein RFI_03907 [Reticulomyxa filosa]